MVRFVKIQLNRIKLLIDRVSSMIRYFFEEFFGSSHDILPLDILACLFNFGDVNFFDNLGYGYFGSKLNPYFGDIFVQIGTESKNQ